MQMGAIFYFFLYSFSFSPCLFFPYFSFPFLSSNRCYLHTPPLPHSRVLGSPGGDVQTHLVPRFLHLMTQFFTAATQGTLLGHLALKATALCSWILWDCENQRFCSWQTTILRALHRQLTKTHFQSLRKRTTSMSETLGLWGRLLVWGSYRGLYRDSQGIEAEGHSLCILSLPHSSSPESSETSLSLLWGPIFLSTARGHLCITRKQVQITK